MYVNSSGAGRGNVSQSNRATNTALAANLNGASHDIDQAQAAGGGAGGQRQTGLLFNLTRQSASAKVDNGQANIHSPVAVGGSSGASVSQENSAANHASAFNLNDTFQRLFQAMGATAFRF